jgi:two-component system LytT family response regulator
MIRSIIIDDEPLARSIIKEYLEDETEIEIVQECGDGFEGVKAIIQHKPDIVFLDIQMPKITGFEMLELIDFPVSIIFTTAYEEYAIKAFEAHAIDYLLKPFSKERFDKSLKKWREQHNTSAIKTTNMAALLEDVVKQPEEQSRVVVKNGNNIKIIPVYEIYYLEAYDDYVKIYTKDGCSLKKKTMNYFEQTFNPGQFVRVHRSYIVQIQQITKIEILEKDTHIALLKSGVKVPLSKSGYTKLKTVLGL